MTRRERRWDTSHPGGKRYAHAIRTIAIGTRSRMPVPKPHTKRRETRRAIKEIREGKNLEAFKTFREFDCAYTLSDNAPYDLEKSDVSDFGQMIQRSKIGKFLNIARLLTKDGYISKEHRPHKLKGQYVGLWECHIEQDWLLIYSVSGRKSSTRSCRYSHRFI